LESNISQNKASGLLKLVLSYQVDIALFLKQNKKRAKKLLPRSHAALLLFIDYIYGHEGLDVVYN